MPYRTFIDDQKMPYHQQDTGDLCGPACMQMLLHALTLAALAAPPIEQNVLLGVLGSVVPPPSVREKGIAIQWTTNPGQLTAALNDVISTHPGLYSTFQGQFQLQGLSSADDLSRSIVTHIEAHRVASVALVYGFQHWLLVRGFMTDIPPNNGPFNILSFDLCDPSPGVPRRVATPVDHIDVEDGCGSGGDRGWANLHVTYEEWLHTGGFDGKGYMTGIPAAIDSTWAGKFVAIVDPQPGDQLPGPTPPVDPVPDSPPLGAVPHGDPEQRAIAGAWTGLTDFGMLDRPDWRRTFPSLDAPEDGGQAIAGVDAAPQVAGIAEPADAPPGATPGRPYRVERLDQEGKFYFIVPYLAQGASPETALPPPVAQLGESPATSPTTILAAAKVDGDTGVYQQSVVAPAPNANAIIIIDPLEALASLVDRGFTFGDHNYPVQKENILDWTPSLVWKPCRESFSAFVPFYAVRIRSTVGEHEVYVRAMDGESFAELHDKLGGA